MPDRVEPGEGASPEPGGRRRLPGLIAVVGLALLLGLRLFVFDVVQVRGPGMVPTLLPGDVVLVSRLGGAELGEIVLFEEQGTRYPRRVVGMPGDRVAVAAGVLTRDGAPVGTGASQEAQVPMGRCGERRATLREELLGEGSAWVEAGGDDLAPLLVAPGERVLLGDHRAEASDARQWGPASMEAIEGVVLMVLWSRSSCDEGWRWDRVLRRVDR